MAAIDCCSVLIVRQRVRAGGMMVYYTENGSFLVYGFVTKSDQCLKLLDALKLAKM